MHKRHQREISSTEKLLDVIRASSTQVSAEELPPSGKTPPAPNATETPRKRFPAFSKGINVAVEIGNDEVRLAKVLQKGDKLHQLLALERIPISKDLDRTSSGFADLLKTSLQSFCGPGERSHIWSVVHHARAEVRQIRIPKVAKKRISDVVHWTARKQANLDEKQSVFDFHVLGEVSEKGVPKLAVMISLAPKEDIGSLKDLFSQIGFPLNGITIASYSIQNLFQTGWVPAGAGSVAHLYIGHEHSRIDILSENRLNLTRSIRTGTDSMAEAMVEEVRLRSAGGSVIFEPSAAEQEVVRVNPASSINTEQARHMICALADEREAADLPHCGDFKRKDILAMIQPATERLVRQVERTFQYFSTTLGNDPVRQLFLSGPMSTCEALRKHFQSQLGVNIEPLDPLDSSLLSRNEVLPPTEPSKRMALTSVIGLALSANPRTPNFLHTFVAREKLARTRLINRSVLIGFLVLVMILSGVFFWQASSIHRSEITLAHLQSKLESFNPRIDQALLTQLATRYKRRQNHLKEKVQDLRPTAVVGEIADLTPANVKLISLAADFGPLTDSKTRMGSSTWTLEGLILGERKTLEPALAAYLVKLNGSSLLDSPVVSKTEFKVFQDLGEVLSFTLNIKGL